MNGIWLLFRKSVQKIELIVKRSTEGPDLFLWRLRVRGEHAIGEALLMTSLEDMIGDARIDR